MTSLPHDPPEKLERAIVALWTAWHMQARLGATSKIRNEEQRLEAKRRIDPLYERAWDELTVCLKELALWRALGTTEVSEP